MRGFAFISILLVLAGCTSMSERTEKNFSAFVGKKAAETELFSNEINRLYWDIFVHKMSFDSLVVKYRYFDKELLRKVESNSGTDEFLNSFYSSGDDLEYLEGLEKSGMIKDPLLKRQLSVLRRKYSVVVNDLTPQSQLLVGNYFKIQEGIDSAATESGIHPAVIALQNREKFRQLKETYVGLIFKLNKLVQESGFHDFFEYQLYIEEIDTAWFAGFLKKMEEISLDDYIRFKGFADSILINRQNFSPDSIGFYEYQAFFRNQYLLPQMHAEVRKDSVLKIIEGYLSQQNLDISDVLEKSDLWYQKGKRDFSFVINIDNKSDIRIYGNYRESPFTLFQLFHEIGHAVHFKYLDKETPFFLKEPPAQVGEGIAMFFKSRLELSPDLISALGIDYGTIKNTPVGDIFNPIDLFMIRRLIAGSEFERVFFANPELNPDSLWGRMVEKYLYIPFNENRTLPFYYYSYHPLTLSAYLEKYLIAFAIAGQMNHLSGNTDFTALLKEKVLKPGNSKHWLELIKDATGEELNPDYCMELIKTK